MTDGARPAHQRVIVVAAAALGGFLLFGNALDALGNALSLISPSVTYVGTALIACAVVVAEAVLPRKPLPWVTNGQPTRIRRLGAIPLAFLSGMTLLLWAPRLLSLARPVDNPGKGSQGEATTFTLRTSAGTASPSPRSGPSSLSPSATTGLTMPVPIRTLSFPLEYVLHPRTGLPYACPLVPETIRYTDAGGATTFPAWQIAEPLLQDVVSSIQSGDSARLSYAYRRVLMKQILETLRFLFSKSWDAEPSHIGLPTGGTQTIYAPRGVRAGTVLSNADVTRAFAGDAFFESWMVPALNLPPSTRLRARTSNTSISLSAANPVVTISIELLDRGVEPGLGLLREMCRMPNDGNALFRRVRFEVRVVSEFTSRATPHPELALYHHWVEVIEREIRRFDAAERWRSLEADYLLVYSRRTQGPVDELLAEAVRGLQQAPIPTLQPTREAPIQ